MQNAKCKMQNGKCGMWNAECGMRIYERMGFMGGMGDMGDMGGMEKWERWGGADDEAAEAKCSTGGAVPAALAAATVVVAEAVMCGGVFVFWIFWNLGFFWDLFFGIWDFRAQRGAARRGAKC
ncbi:MAG: hypothetical protein LBC18_10035 [Opitutaceae bacterium]|jgi:hypothetical protein|nr:hypothetical protein [Opitutaceae bacterium]